MPKLKTDNIKSHHRLFHRWSTMMTKCYVETNYKYPRYGGAGVKVFSEWHDFDAYAEYFKHVEEEDLIKRINPKGNFEPSNMKVVRPTDELKCNDILYARWYGIVRRSKRDQLNRIIRTKVCDEWLDYKNFKNHFKDFKVGDRLKRINNSEGWTPDNTIVIKSKRRTNQWEMNWSIKGTTYNTY